MRVDAAAVEPEVVNVMSSRTMSHCVSANFAGKDSTTRVFLV